MALSKVKNDLDSLLKCQLCRDIIEKPHTLTCFHSYCKGCITKRFVQVGDQNQAGVKCPICNAWTDKQNVKPRLLMTELLDLYCTAEGGVYRCQQCQDLDCKWTCTDCRIDICEKCKLIHLRIPLLRNHTVVEFNKLKDSYCDRMIFCSKHKDEPLKLYCKQCKATICVICKMSTHAEHAAETIDEALGEVVESLRKSMEKVKSKLECMNEDQATVVQKVEEVKETFKKQREEIEKTFEKVILKAKIEKESMLTEINAYEKKEIDAMNCMKLNEEFKKKEYQQVCDWAQTSLDTARGVTLMSEIEDGLNAKLNEVVKSKETSAMNIPNVNFIPSNIFKEGSAIVGNLQFQTIRHPLSAGKNLGKHQFFNISIKEIFKGDLDVVEEVELSDMPQRMSMVNDTIWIPVPSSNAIHIYASKTEQLQLVKTLSCEFSPNAVAQSSDFKIIVASNSGLYVIGEEGNVLTTICQGNFKDVCFVDDDTIYAICSQCEVHMFSKSSTTDCWNKKLHYVCDRCGSKEFHEKTCTAMGYESQASFCSSCNMCYECSHNAHGRALPMFGEVEKVQLSHNAYMRAVPMFGEVEEVELSHNAHMRVVPMFGQAFSSNISLCSWQENIFANSPSSPHFIQRYNLNCEKQDYLQCNYNNPVICGVDMNGCILVSFPDQQKLGFFDIATEGNEFMPFLGFKGIVLDVILNNDNYLWTLERQEEAEVVSNNIKNKCVAITAVNRRGHVKKNHIIRKYVRLEEKL